jgi:hypothetical protein
MISKSDRECAAETSTRRPGTSTPRRVDRVAETPGEIKPAPRRLDAFRTARPVDCALREEHGWIFDETGHPGFQGVASSVVPNSEGVADVGPEEYGVPRKIKTSAPGWTALAQRITYFGYLTQGIPVEAYHHEFRWEIPRRRPCPCPECGAEIEFDVARDPETGKTCLARIPIVERFDRPAANPDWDLPRAAFKPFPSKRRNP